MPRMTPSMRPDWISRRITIHQSRSLISPRASARMIKVAARRGVAQPFPQGQISRPAFEKVRDLEERAEPAPVMQNMPKDVENLKDQLVFFAKRAKAKALPASGAQSC